MRRFFLLFLLLFVGVWLAPPARAQTSTSLVIHEVQTTGCQTFVGTVCQVEEPSQEFIELLNLGKDAASVNGWRLEYLSATHTGLAPPTRVLTTLHGQLASESTMLVGFGDWYPQADAQFGTGTSGSLAKSGGRVRLVTAEGQTVNMVGWGAAVPLVGSMMGEAPKAGQSLQYNRVNDEVMYLLGVPTPEPGGLLQSRCELVVSELLANPLGSDAEGEFIELYNPTPQAQPLSSCRLQLNDAELVSLGEAEVRANEYVAISAKTIGITLPNAAGGSVTLVGGDEEVTVTYPGTLKEGQSWGTIDAEWRALDPSPGAVNRMLSVVPKPASVIPACPAGKYRHPETKRCRNKAAPIVAKVCLVGYVRNPATGRCKKAAANGVMLASCKPGYSRHPETNRCRKIVASSAPKPCREGYERHPETNRCRKIVDMSAPTFKVDKTPPPANVQTGWLIAGAVMVGLIAYGVYEWRRELRGIATRLKQRLVRAS